MSDHLGTGQPDYWRELFESLAGQKVTLWLVATGNSGSKWYHEGVVVRPGSSFVECVETWTVESGRPASQTTYVSYDHIVKVVLAGKYTD